MMPYPPAALAAATWSATGAWLIKVDKESNNLWAVSEMLASNRRVMAGRPSGIDRNSYTRRFARKARRAWRLAGSPGMSSAFRRVEQHLLKAKIGLPA